MNRLLLHRIRAIDFWHEPHSSLPRSSVPSSKLHYERDSSGFLFTRSFANAIWRGLGPAVRDALEQDKRA